MTRNAAFSAAIFEFVGAQLYPERSRRDAAPRWA